MKFLKQHLSVLLLCLFEILVGALLLVDPKSFTKGILMGAGVVLILLGLVQLLRYFREDPVEAAVGQTMTKGLLAIAAGAVVIWQVDAIVSAISMLSILYGAAVLVSGVAKIQWTVDMLRLKSGRWFLNALSAVISLVCGWVILANPFVSMEVLWMFTGIALIVEAVFDIVVLFLAGKTVDAIKNEQ